MTHFCESKSLNRSVSFGVLICFLASSVLTPAAASAQPADPDTRSAPYRQLLADITKIQIPEELGKVEEAFNGTGNKRVVLIQDAHSIPEAQRSIQKVIDHFQREYGFGLVALEGASGPLDPEIFKSFPEPETLQKVFQEYFDRGELTGGNAAALFNERKAVYHGVEDWALYEEGLSLYQEAMRHEPGILEELKVWKENLGQRKAKAYSKELLEIDRLLSDFYEDHADLAPVLTRFASIQEPAPGTELSLLLGEIRKNPRGEAALQLEVKNLAGQVKSFLKSRETAQEGKAKLKAFHEKYQEFQTSRLTPEAFVLFLKELIAEFHLSFKVSEELGRLAGNQKRIQEIEGTRLYRDLLQYAEAVKGSLVKTPAERSLNQESDRFQLLRRLARLELTFEDWDRLGRHSDESNLLRLFSPHLAFYENSEKRDQAFFKHLTQLMKETKSERAVLVAGGFHTERLTRRFKEEGVSFLLVRPGIPSIPETSFYRDQMRGEVSWKDYFKVENGRVNFYKAFVRSTRGRLLKSYESRVTGYGLTRNSQPVTRNSLFLLKAWRDQIIRDLARQDRIQDAGQYTPLIDEAAAGLTGASLPIQDQRLNEWLANIDRFVQGLRNLQSRSQLTQQNVLKLLQPSAIPAGAVSTVFSFSDSGLPQSVGLPPGTAGVKTLPSSLRVLGPDTVRDKGEAIPDPSAEPAPPKKAPQNLANVPAKPKGPSRAEVRGSRKEEMRERWGGFLDEFEKQKGKVEKQWVLIEKIEAQLRRELAREEPFFTGGDLERLAAILKETLVTVPYEAGESDTDANVLKRDLFRLLAVLFLLGHDETVPVAFGDFVYDHPEVTAAAGLPLPREVEVAGLQEILDLLRNREKFSSFYRRRIEERINPDFIHDLIKWSKRPDSVKSWRLTTLLHYLIRESKETKDFPLLPFEALKQDQELQAGIRELLEERPDVSVHPATRYTALLALQELGASFDAKTQEAVRGAVWKKVRESPEELFSREERNRQTQGETVTPPGRILEDYLKKGKRLIVMETDTLPELWPGQPEFAAWEEFLHLARQGLVTHLVLPVSKEFHPQFEAFYREGKIDPAFRDKELIEGHVLQDDVRHLFDYGPAKTEEAARKRVVKPFQRILGKLSKHLSIVLLPAYGAAEEEETILREILKDPKARVVVYGGVELSFTREWPEAVRIFEVGPTAVNSSFTFGLRLRGTLFESIWWELPRDRGVRPLKEFFDGFIYRAKEDEGGRHLLFSPKGRVNEFIGKYPEMGKAFGRKFLVRHFGTIQSIVRQQFKDENREYAEARIRILFRELLPSFVKRFGPIWVQERWDDLVDIGNNAGFAFVGASQALLDLASEGALGVDFIKKHWSDFYRFGTGTTLDFSKNIFEALLDFIRMGPGTEWVKEKWSDVVKMGLALGTLHPLVELFRIRTIPSERAHRKFSPRWVQDHWEGLRRIATSGIGNPGEVIAVDIPALRRRHGRKWLDRHWEKLVQLATREGGAEALRHFSDGFQGVARSMEVNGRSTGWEKGSAWLWLSENSSGLLDWALASKDPNRFFNISAGRLAGAFTKDWLDRNWRSMVDFYLAGGEEAEVILTEILPAAIAAWPFSDWDPLQPALEKFRELQRLFAEAFPEDAKERVRLLHAARWLVRVIAAKNLIAMGQMLVEFSKDERLTGPEKEERRRWFFDEGLSAVRAVAKENDFSSLRELGRQMIQTGPYQWWNAQRTLTKAREALNSAEALLREEIPSEKLGDRKEEFREAIEKVREGESSLKEFSEDPNRLIHEPAKEIRADLKRAREKLHARFKEARERARQKAEEEKKYEAWQKGIEKLIQKMIKEYKRVLTARSLKELKGRLGFEEAIASVSSGGAPSGGGGMGLGQSMEMSQELTMVEVLAQVLEHYVGITVDEALAEKHQDRFIRALNTILPHEVGHVIEWNGGRFELVAPEFDAGRFALLGEAELIEAIAEEVVVDAIGFALATQIYTHSEKMPAEDLTGVEKALLGLRDTIEIFLDYVRTKEGAAAVGESLLPNLARLQGQLEWHLKVNKTPVRDTFREELIQLTTRMREFAHGRLSSVDEKETYDRLAEAFGNHFSQVKFRLGPKSEKEKPGLGNVLGDSSAFVGALEARAASSRSEVRIDLESQLSEGQKQHIEYLAAQYEKIVGPIFDKIEGILDKLAEEEERKIPQNEAAKEALNELEISVFLKTDEFLNTLNMNSFPDKLLAKTITFEIRGVLGTMTWSIFGGGPPKEMVAFFKDVRLREGRQKIENLKRLSSVPEIFFTYSVWRDPIVDMERTFPETLTVEGNGSDRLSDLIERGILTKHLEAKVPQTAANLSTRIRIFLIQVKSPSETETVWFEKGISMAQLHKGDEAQQKLGIGVSATVTYQISRAEVRKDFEIEQVGKGRIAVSGPGLKNFLFGRVAVIAKRIERLFPYAPQAKENKIRRGRIAFEKRRRGQKPVWSFEFNKKNLLRIAQYLRLPIRRELPKFESGYIPVTKNGMYENFSGHSGRLAKRIQAELPDPVSSRKTKVIRRGIAFELGWSQHAGVKWFFRKTDREKVARVYQLRLKLKLPRLTQNRVAVSGPSLAKIFEGWPNKLANHFYKDLPNPETSEKTQIVVGGVRFKLMMTGTLRRWAFPRRGRDIEKLAARYDLWLRGKLRRVSADEIRVTEAGLSRIFEGRPKAMNRLIRSKLPIPRTTSRRQVTVKGIIFYLRRSGNRRIWVLRERDKEKVAKVFGLTLRQDVWVQWDPLTLADALALLGQDPLRFQQYLRIYHPELSQEEVESISVASLRGLRTEFPEEEKLHLNYKETLPQPTVSQDVHSTKGHSVVIDGRTRTQTAHLQVIGDYTRRIVLRKDGTFKTTLPLPKTGEVNEFFIYAVDPERHKKSPPVEVRVHQTGLKQDTEEAFFKLLALKEEVLEGIQKDPARYRFLLRAVEHSLLRHFTYDEPAGFRYLRKRIRREKSPAQKRLLQTVFKKFRAIQKQDFGLKPGERLYFFQKYTVYEIHSLIQEGARGVLIASEQGLGKTVTALAAINGEKAVILAPNPVVSTWTEEEGHFFPAPHLERLEGSSWEKEKALASLRRPQAVINIEFTRGMTDRRTELLSRPRGSLVVDEAAYLGSKNAQQAQGTRQIQALFKLLLTATPFKRISQIGYLLGFIYPNDPRFRSARAFARAFPSGDRDALNALFLLFQQHMIRIRKQDVFQTYDPEIPLEHQSDRLPRKIEIPPEKKGRFLLLREQMESILELFTNYQAWCRKHRRLASFEDKQYHRFSEGYFSKREALRQIMNDPAYIGRPDLKSPKHRMMDKIIGEEHTQNPSVKILVFARYRAQVEEYIKRYPHLGARAYYGGLRKNAKGYRIDDQGNILYYKADEYRNFELGENGRPILSNPEHGRPILALDYERILFQNDSSVQVLVATYDTGALGVTLSAADVVIFDDLAPTYQDEYQAAERAHRIDNQRKKYSIRYYWLQAQYLKSFMRSIPQDIVKKYFDTGTYDQVHHQNIRGQSKVFHRAMDGVGSEEEVRALHRRFMKEHMPFLFERKGRGQDGKQLRFEGVTPPPSRRRAEPALPARGELRRAENRGEASAERKQSRAEVRTEREEERRRVEETAGVFVRKNEESIEDAAAFRQLIVDGLATGEELDFAIQRVRAMSLYLHLDQEIDERSRAAVANLLEVVPGFSAAFLGLRDEFKSKIAAPSVRRTFLKMANFLNFTEGTTLEFKTLDEEGHFIVRNRMPGIFRPRTVPTAGHEASFKEPRSKLAAELWSLGEWVSPGSERRVILPTDEGITDVAILTQNDPESLERSLESYLHNLALFGHSNVRLHVFDDTNAGENPEIVEANQKIVEKMEAVLKKYGLANGIHYVGHKDKMAFLARLAEKVAERIQGSKYSPADVERGVQNTFARGAGGHRNFVQLVLSGRKIVMADGDSEPKVLVNPEALEKEADGETPDPAALAPTEVYLRDFEELRDDPVRHLVLPVDFISAFNRLLGKSAEALSSYARFGDEESSDETMFIPAKEPLQGIVTHVRSMASGHHDVGWVGSSEPGLLSQFFDQSEGGNFLTERRLETVKEFFSGIHPLRRRFEGPLPSAVVLREGRGNIVTQMAFDLTRPITPFLPSKLRIEDLVYSTMHQMVYPDALNAISAVGSFHERSRSAPARKTLADEVWGEISGIFPGGALLLLLRKAVFKFDRSKESPLAIPRVASSMLKGLEPGGKDAEWLNSLQKSIVQILVQLLIIIREAQQLTAFLAGRQASDDESRRALVQAFIDHFARKLALEFPSPESMRDAATRRPFIEKYLDSAGTLFFQTAVEEFRIWVDTFDLWEFLVEEGQALLKETPLIPSPSSTRSEARAEEKGKGERLKKIPAGQARNEISGRGALFFQHASQNRRPPVRRISKESPPDKPRSIRPSKVPPSSVYPDRHQDRNAVEPASHKNIRPTKSLLFDVTGEYPPRQNGVPRIKERLTERFSLPPAQPNALRNHKLTLLAFQLAKGILRLISQKSIKYYQLETVHIKGVTPPPLRRRAEVRAKESWKPEGGRWNGEAILKEATNPSTLDLLPSTSPFRSEARGTSVLENPFPNLNPNSGLTVSDLIWDGFTGKAEMVTLASGGPIRVPRFVILRWEGDERDRGYVPELVDPRYLADLVTFIRENVLGAAGPVAYVYKPNSSQGGMGIFFLEKDRNGNVLITIADVPEARSNRFSETHPTGIRYLSTLSNGDIMQFTLPAKMNMDGKLQAISTLWKSGSWNKDDQDPGMMQEMVSAVKVKRDGREFAYETRHFVQGSMTGQVKPVILENTLEPIIGTHHGAFGKVGSSRYFSNQSLREPRALDLKGPSIYNPLLEAFPYLSNVETRKKFNAYVNRLLFEEFDYLRKRLLQAGIALDFELLFVIDLQWLPPAKRGGFPVPVIIESNLLVPNGLELARTVLDQTIPNGSRAEVRGGKKSGRPPTIQPLLETRESKLQGLNISQAAKEIRVSRKGLWLHLENHPKDFTRYGIKRLTKIPSLLEAHKAKLQGLNISEAAEVIGVSQRGLSGHLQNHPKDFTRYGIVKRGPGREPEIPSLLKAHKSKLQGLNITEAAQVIGVSLSGLSGHLQNHPKDFKRYGIRKGRSEVRGAGRPLDFGEGGYTVIKLGGSYRNPKTDEEYRYIDDIKLSLEKLRTLAVPWLSFQIVKRGAEPEGEAAVQAVRDEPVKKSKMRGPYVLRVYDSGRWRDLPQVELEEGQSIFIGREERPDGDMAGPGQKSLQIFPLDLDPVGEPGWRSVIYWVENGAEKKIFLEAGLSSNWTSRVMSEADTAIPVYDLRSEKLNRTYVRPGHLEIRLAGDEVILTDHGSRNGTFYEILSEDLKGAQVPETLDHTTQTHVGTFRLLFGEENQVRPQSAPLVFEYAGPFQILAQRDNVLTPEIGYFAVKDGTIYEYDPKRGKLLEEWKAANSPVYTLRVEKKGGKFRILVENLSSYSVIVIGLKPRSEARLPDRQAGLPAGGQARGSDMIEPIPTLRAELRNQDDDYFHQLRKDLAVESFDSQSIDESPPDYSRVVPEEMIREAFNQVPDFLVKFLGLNYLYVIASDPETLRTPPMEYWVEVVEDREEAKKKLFSTLFVWDIPGQFFDLFTAASVEISNQQLPKQRVSSSLKLLRKLANKLHWSWLAEYDEAAVSPLNPDFQTVQKIARQGLLFVIGHMLWFILFNPDGPHYLSGQEAGNLKKEWQKTYRRHGVIYNRSISRPETYIVRMGPKVIVSQNSEAYLERDMFGFTFAHYLRPDSIYGELGEKPISRHESDFIEMILGIVEQKAAEFKNPLPDTFSPSRRSEARRDLKLFLVALEEEFGNQPFGTKDLIAKGMKSPYDYLLDAKGNYLRQLNETRGRGGEYLFQLNPKGHEAAKERKEQLKEWQLPYLFSFNRGPHRRSRKPYEPSVGQRLATARSRILLIPQEDLTVETIARVLGVRSDHLRKYLKDPGNVLDKELLSKFNPIITRIRRIQKDLYQLALTALTGMKSEGPYDPFAHLYASTYDLGTQQTNAKRSEARLPADTSGRQARAEERKRSYELRIDTNVVAATLALAPRGIRSELRDRGIEIPSPEAAARTVVGLAAETSDLQELALRFRASALKIFSESLSVSSRVTALDPKELLKAQTALLDTLKQIHRRSASLGIYLPPGSGKFELESFTRILIDLIQRGAGDTEISEIVLNQDAPNDGMNSLHRGLGAFPRRHDFSKPIVFKTSQNGAALIVAGDPLTNVSIDPSFLPVQSNLKGVEDNPLVADYVKLSKIVLALHLTDLIAGNKELLREPDLLKRALLERFSSLPGFGDTLQVSGNQFTIVGSAVRKFLVEAQARAELLQAA